MSGRPGSSPAAEGAARAPGATLARRLAADIRRHGPLPYDRFLDACLYDPEEGFFARGAGAGRAGADFLTSPEVGGLFALLVGRALDGWWEALGSPDPFFVVELGAGRGRLAADVLRSAPRCAPALRYLLVERAEALRRAQSELLVLEPLAEVLGPAAASTGEEGEQPVWLPRRGPLCAALAQLPAGSLEGVVLANELLDNLPPRLVERSGDAWLEVRVGLGEGPGEPFAEVLLPADPALAADVDELLPSGGVPPGTRLPVSYQATALLGACGSMLRRGYVLLVDYADAVAGLAARGQRSWMRTYRSHRRGDDPLVAPGLQDVTCDVVLEAVRRDARRAGLAVLAEASQAEWLNGLGVEALVTEARAAWQPGSRDLPALAARSRVLEAEALTDAEGLGAHRVVLLGRGVDGEGALG